MRPDEPQQEAGGDALHAERHAERGIGGEADIHRGIEIAETDHHPADARRPGAIRNPTAKNPPPARQKRSTERNSFMLLVARAGRQKLGLDRRDLRHRVEEHELRADEDGGDREEQRRRVERQLAELERSGDERRRDQRPHACERAARIEEQPMRSEFEQELQMPPAVAPAAKMRRARAAVGRERRRNFGDFQLRDRRLHHHLGGEFHA